MGFLDLLMGKRKKKESGDIPPPAPGPNKKDVSVENAPTPGQELPVAPPAPENQAQAAAPPPAPERPASGAPPSATDNIPSFPSQPGTEKQPIDTKTQVPQIRIPAPPTAVKESDEYDFALPKIDVPDMKKTESPGQKEPTSPEKVDFEKENDVNEMVQDENKRIFDKKLKVHKFAGGAIFIEVKDYKHVLNSLDELRENMKNVAKYMVKLEQYNEKKHSEFEQWKATLEDMQRKFLFVEKTLFQKG